MATTYPSAIDTSTSLPIVFDNLTIVSADTVNRIRTAIISVEQTLGINPQGTISGIVTVRARLDSLDTTISDLNTAVSNVVSEIDAIIATLTGEAIDLGIPSGGFSNGITTLQPTTPITEAINTFNNIMSYLAPAQAHSINALAIDAVTSVPIFTGNISHNSSQPSAYYGPFAAGTSCGVITKTQVFTLQTHNTGDASTGFSDADKGTLTLVIVNAATTNSYQFSLVTAFDENHRADIAGQGVTYSGNTGSATPPLKIVSTSPANLFQIYSVALFNSFPLWQKGVARITNSTLSSGFNSFQFTHQVGASTRNSTIYQLFYDNNATPPNFASTPTLSVSPSPSSINYLSGIKFLSIGEPLTLSATINNTFKNTYLTTPLSYSFTAGLPASSSAITDGALSGFTLAAPDVSEHITINKVFNISLANQQTINQIATINFTNVFDNIFSSATASINALINTFNTPASTAIAEYFVDENHRLIPDINGATGASAPYPNDYVGIPSVITGQWASNNILVNGNAQAYNAQLIYPVNNFTVGYAPTQQAGTNYSGFNNSNSHSGQVYYRAMFSSGNPRSTGTLTINGITLADLTGTPNVKVELRLPGAFGTGWLNLALPFNSGTFTGITGDGCLAGNSGSIFNWSAGTFTTGNTGFLYILRITLFNTTRQISSLTESFT